MTLCCINYVSLIHCLGQKHNGRLLGVSYSGLMNSDGHMINPTLSR